MCVRVCVRVWRPWRSTRGCWQLLTRGRGDKSGCSRCPLTAAAGAPTGRQACTVADSARLACSWAGCKRKRGKGWRRPMCDPCDNNNSIQSHLTRSPRPTARALRFSSPRRRRRLYFGPSPHWPGASFSCLARALAPQQWRSRPSEALLVYSCLLRRGRAAGQGSANALYASTRTPRPDAALAGARLPKRTSSARSTRQLRPRP